MNFYLSLLIVCDSSYILSKRVFSLDFHAGCSCASIICLLSVEFWFLSYPFQLKAAAERRLYDYLEELCLVARSKLRLEPMLVR